MIKVNNNWPLKYKKLKISRNKEKMMLEIINEKPNRTKKIDKDKERSLNQTKNNSKKSKKNSEI